ncbi:helix-turn-helix transcriptional regulator [Mycobacterium sp. IS-1496]|uniref:helix-turn-helix transcriptional regulator n=1 Tax=Mycobacterium sp. IS-1496 TaxID=1772284 RepID=UPI00074153C1|nr:LuxR family transcriptional regulator [Mycobacterium sp. IS-1496]KUI26127.1 helix-turn-helix transcriptional regulator [Mycobacterium sp. IS-1496]
MGNRWQLLDRAGERDFIRSALSDADKRGVVLVGQAGVGKTTLARTATATIPSVRWASCTESSKVIPLGAFAPWVTMTAARDPIALLTSAREALLDADDTVLGVDDAHLLDQLSATLLHQVAVEGSGRIIATVRSGEAVPDAVTSLWKDGILERLELHPFTKSQCISLVQRVLRGTVEGLSADVMWNSSSGNPLFLRHLVEGALAAGALTEVNGVWQLRGHAAVSSGMVALLEARLDRAGAEALSALKVLALYEPLDLDTLCALAGAEAVDAGETQGLIHVVQDGGQLNARISHPLFGDVIRQRIGTASARRLRGRIVDVLSTREPDSAATRIRLAELYVGSDRDVDDALLIDAGKDALFLANLETAERFARLAFERHGDLRAAGLLSRALLWQGRAAEADDILALFDPAALDESQLVLWGLPRLSILFWAVGDVERAHRLLGVLHRRVAHPALRAIVSAVGAAMAVHENRIADGLHAARAVIDNPDAPEQAVEFAALAAGLALPAIGHGDGFEPIAALCRPDLTPTDGMIRFMIRYGLVVARVYSGELDAADAAVAQCARFSSCGQFVGWAITKIMAGCVEVYRGHFPDAVSSLEQALAALNAENSMPWRLVARLLLVRAYSALGDTKSAERVLAETTGQLGPHMALHHPQALIAKAWMVAARGGGRTAIDLARTAADLAHRSGQFAVEAEALHHAARFGDRAAAPRLAALARVVDGGVVNLHRRHAAALASADAERLDAVSRDYQEAGYLLSAADSAAQAAVLHEIDGWPRKGADSAARALKLAAECGGAITPAIGSAARPLPLSSRELEVAVLVAEGLTNREVAERLTVSVRTVENHIYRSCAKLDLRDRADLAAAVRRQPARKSSSPLLTRVPGQAP